jgi:hypothetical protein
MRKEVTMGLRELAEGIILQSIEDLSDEDLREDCITFFKGDDFTVCARLAAIDVADQVTLLRMVKSAIEYQAKSSGAPRLGFKKYGKKRGEVQSAPLPFS